MKLFHIYDKKKDKDLECYIDVMRLENPFEFLKYKSREEFNDKLKTNNISNISNSF